MFWFGKLASAPSNVNITKANGHSEANTQRHVIYIIDFLKIYIVRDQLIMLVYFVVRIFTEQDGWMHRTCAKQRSIRAKVFGNIQCSCGILSTAQSPAFETILFYLTRNRNSSFSVPRTKETRRN